MYLFDRVQYSLAQLKDLYHLRWEEEEFFKLTKGLLEAESFCGKCLLLIGQELMAIHLYCLLTRILIMECAISKGIPLAQIAQQAAFPAVSHSLPQRTCFSSIHSCLTHPAVLGEQGAIRPVLCKHAFHLFQLVDNDHHGIFVSPFKELGSHEHW